MDAKTAGDALARLTVVDVREPYEWKAGRIDGAIHIPLGELQSRAAELDDTGPLLFVCRVGGRSARATQHFRGQGRNAENLEGGMLAWADAGLPITRPDGTPGEVAPH